MIRPFTLICMVLAGGSGLYLYQCKHQAQMLDREIAKTVKQTEATRERIGMLRAEWALLNEPERLTELAHAHTTLQTLQPAQFVAMNDLAAKLPAPALPGSQHPPAEAEPEETPAVAAVAPLAPKPTQVADAAAEAKPVAVPEPKPALAVAEPKPARHATRPAPVQVAAESTPAHTRPLPRPTASVLPVGVSSEATAPGTIGAAVLRAMRANGYSATAPAPAPAYVRPAYAPAYAPAASYAAPAGSMLGRSGGSLPPPVPFAAR